MFPLSLTAEKRTSIFPYIPIFSVTYSAMVCQYPPIIRFARAIPLQTSVFIIRNDRIW